MSDDASVDSQRTSDNAWDMTSPAAIAIMKRVFTLVRMPFNQNQADGLQIVRYRATNAYRQHHDYFPQGSYRSHNFDPASGGTNRFVTIFLYLNDVAEGGQTVFPSSSTLPDAILNELSPDAAKFLSSHKNKEEMLPKMEELFKPGSWQEIMTKECYSALSVRPKMGSAVLFYSMTPNWKLDPMSLHGGCPVIDGVKWGANIWVWNGPRYDTVPSTTPPPTDNYNDPNMSVRFTNTFDKTGILYWKQMELITLEPGHSSEHNTYDTHTFRFEIDGVSVWSHTMNKRQEGRDQAWFIGPKLGQSATHDEL